MRQSPAPARRRRSTCSEAGGRPAPPPSRSRRPTRADAQREHGAALTGVRLPLLFPCVSTLASACSVGAVALLPSPGSGRTEPPVGTAPCASNQERHLSGAGTSEQ